MLQSARRKRIECGLDSEMLTGDATGERPSKGTRAVMQVDFLNEKEGGQ